MWLRLISARRTASTEAFALSPTLTIPETIFAVDTNTSSDFFVSVISRMKPFPETIPVSPT